jgi:hypothetical protein
MAIRRKKNNSPSSPIGAKQEALLQQQEQLRLRMQKLESLLAEAPKRAEELERRRREEGVAQSTGRNRCLNVPSGVNVRLNSFAGTASAPRKLGKERKQAKRHFVVLCLLLLAMLFFLYTQFAR